MIPSTRNICKSLYHLTHDELGHFGTDKMYLTLHNLYYWPNMHYNLECNYIPGCNTCQQNKNPTMKPTGLLHPLLVLNVCFESVVIDFVRLLPEDSRYNRIVTMTDRLGGTNIWIELCRMDMTVEEFAELFFSK